MVVILGGLRSRTFRAAGAACAMLGGMYAQAAVQFSDVTQAVGIQHVQWVTEGTAQAGEARFFTGGAAAADYDGDGWIDLYVTRLLEPDILYRNVGGQFVNVTASVFHAFHLEGVPTNGVAWADIDNDGDQDLYVTAIDAYRYFLYINNGNGKFSEQGLTRNAVVNRQPPNTPKNGMSVAFGDYDLDGYLDIFTSDWGSVGTDGLPDARLLRNRGAAQPGYFLDKTIEAGLSYNAVTQAGVRVFGFSPRFADMDDDGWPDLALAADFGTSRLWWNNGNGTFSNGTVAAGVGKEENGMGSAIGDYDGDGRLDWFVTSIWDPFDTCATGECFWGTTGNRLYRNNGNRTFSDQTTAKGVRAGGWGWGTSWFDYDNDGDLDLIMVNGIDFPLGTQDAQYNHDRTRVWRNDGPGRPFVDVTDALGITDDGEGKGIVIFDYDNDGDLDIFIVNHAGAPVLYRNDGGNANDWLRIKTVGTLSNRDGIGAKITITPDLDQPGRLMFHEVSGGSNFLSHNERIAHFGLGPSSAVVDRIVIRWPSGFVQTLYNITPNQLLTITEGLYVLGDMDGNTVLDAFDVSAFELALADPADYALRYPGLDPHFIGDMNGDGVLNAFDVGAFEAALAGGVVPEPGGMFGLLMVGALARGRSRGQRSDCLCGGSRG